MSTPMLVLDSGSPVPPYEQIGAQLRAQIASGRLAPGSMLPSVRQLGRDLGVAPNTIVRAYNELEHDGWVISSARRGVMVAERPRAANRDERAAQLEQAVAQLLITAHQLGVDAAELYAEIARQMSETNEEIRKHAAR